ncbi:hypothetical protein [Actinoplanes derwentensis]
MREMMGKLKNWFAVALAVVTLNVLVPAQAWASEPVLEAARRSSRGGGFGFVLMFCCAAVVIGAVVIVVLITRRRKR